MAKRNPSYRELKRAVEEHPAPWKVVGNGRNVVVILDANEVNPLMIGVDRNLARRIVAAINAKEAK